MNTMELINGTAITTTPNTEGIVLPKEHVLSNPLYISVLGALLALTLYDIWFRNTDAYKKLKTIPGPPVFPLIGNAHLILGLTPTGEFLQKLHEIPFNYFFLYEISIRLYFRTGAKSPAVHASLW